MLPEEFCIHRPVAEGGVLVGIFHHSMSMRGAIEKGYFPTQEVLNDFLACGFDDVELDGSFLPPHQESAVIRWKPFELAKQEYDDFIAYLHSLGRPFEVTDFGVTMYQAWFNRCFA